MNLNRKNHSKNRTLFWVSALLYWTGTFCGQTASVSSGLPAPEKIFATMLLDAKKTNDIETYQAVYEYVRNGFQCENIEKASLIYNAYTQTAKNYAAADRQAMPHCIKQCEQFFLDNLMKRTRILPGLSRDTHEGTPLITPHVYNELEVHYLMNTLAAKTQTAFGAYALQAYRPISNHDKILHRQNLIKKFADNKTLYQDTQQLLTQIHHHEHLFFNPLFNYSEHYFLKAYPLRSLIEFFRQFFYDNKEIRSIMPLLGSSSTSAQIGFFMTLLNPVLDLMCITLLSGFFDPASYNTTHGASSNLITKAANILFSQASNALKPLSMAYTKPQNNQASKASLITFMALNQQSIPHRTETLKEALHQTWTNMDKKWSFFGWETSQESFLKSKLTALGNALKDSSMAPRITTIDEKITPYTKTGLKYVGANDDAIELMAHNKTITALAAAKGIAVSYAALIHLYKTFYEVKDGFSKVSHLKTYLHDVHGFINQSKKLSHVMEQDPSTKPYSTALNTLIAYPEFDEFITLLNKPTFSDNKTILYNQGDVIRAMYLLKKMHPFLMKMGTLIGEIDTYASLSTLISTPSSENRFSCATFLESATPLLHAENMWIASALKTKPVTNTVTLGTDNHGSIKTVITGPTGAGKTVFLRSIGHLIALTHTFGIGPADTITLSFFDSMVTCFPRKESQQAGASRFMTAQKNMDDVKEFVRTHPTDKIALLIDEPYSGTTEKHRALLTYNFGIEIKDNPLLLCLLAAHVYQPTTLEEETHGIFKNYQPEIIEEQPGVFVNTFKILPGPALWWFNEQDKVTRYNDWLSTRINP